MDVIVWLRSLGLGQYEAAFRDNEIDETVLPGLTAEDLKELGVAALGHRLKLLRCRWCMHTCCATLPATRWRILARTPGQSRLISATRTSGIRSGTPSCRRPGSRTSSRTDGKRNREAHPSPGSRAGAFRSNEVAPIDRGRFGRPRAQRQRFTSTRQRLKAPGWRGIELGPVELLLNAVKGFFPDLAPRAQPLQCRALGGDRA
jgi:hypothetical protein